MLVALLSALLCCAQVSAPPQTTPSAGASPPSASASIAAAVTIRVATFNIEDVRTTDLLVNDRPRLKGIAEVIQRLRPNVIFLNEIAYDGPGSPGFKEGDSPGQNARRFIDQYLSSPQAPGLMPIRYRAFMAPVNTGIASGFDLDNDGAVVNEFLIPEEAPTGPPPQPSEAGRRYGGDCWGFGTFPGQYGMALLVDERLAILADQVRTFQLYPWDYLPGAFFPTQPDGKPWFTDEERAIARLSSKSHWDVPVQLPNGQTLHFLCSHPTPPAFDGPEIRNRKRNHDEIRLWVEYIENQPCVVDDAGQEGGLSQTSPFVIVGDLNADPDKGNSFKDPIRRLLMHCKRINTDVTPAADQAWSKLTPTDTAQFGLRVDYVLPSTDLTVGKSGIWRNPPAGSTTFPSDHFPVWMDLTVPPRQSSAPAHESTGP